MPICTYPDGTSFYLNDAADPNPASTIVDPNELLTSVLESAFEGLSEVGNANTVEALASLNAADIVENLLIKDESGENAVEVIVVGQTNSGNAGWTEDGSQQWVENTSTEIDPELEQNIQEQIQDMIDAENPI